MEEYRSRFERERTRLGLALQKTDACTKIISEVHTSYDSISRSGLCACVRVCVCVRV
jgi:hypothetical protein